MEYFFWVIFNRNSTPNNCIVDANSMFRGQNEPGAVTWGDAQKLMPGQTLVITLVTPNKSSHVYIRAE